MAKIESWLSCWVILFSQILFSWYHRTSKLHPVLQMFRKHQKFAHSHILSLIADRTQNNGEELCALDPYPLEEH